MVTAVRAFSNRPPTPNSRPSSADSTSGQLTTPQFHVAVSGLKGREKLVRPAKIANKNWVTKVIVVKEVVATSTISLLHQISHNNWDKLFCFSGWVGWFEKLQPWRGQRQLHYHFPSTPLRYSKRTWSSWIQVTLLGLFLCIPTTVLRFILETCWK